LWGCSDKLHKLFRPVPTVPGFRMYKYRTQVHEEEGGTYDHLNFFYLPQTSHSGFSLFSLTIISNKRPMQGQGPWLRYYSIYFPRRVKEKCEKLIKNKYYTITSTYIEHVTPHICTWDCGCVHRRTVLDKIKNKYPFAFLHTISSIAIESVGFRRGVSLEIATALSV
jgi:hypothetical protein